MSLTQKKCVPCHGGLDPLSANDAAKLLDQAPGWSLIDGGSKIQRRFTFINFVDALKFANKVGELAEAEGHHPDVTIGWGFCSVLTYTHKINGLHENDFILAAKINQIR